MAATRFLVGVTLTFILAGQSIGKPIEEAPSEVEPNAAQSAEVRQADRIPRAAMGSRMGMPKNFLANTGVNQAEDVAPKNPYRIISDARSARRLQAGRRGGSRVNGFYSGAGSQSYPQPRYNSRTRVRHAGHRGLRPYGGGVAPGSQRHPFGPSGYGAGPGRRSFSPPNDSPSFPGYYEN